MRLLSAGIVLCCAASTASGQGYLYESDQQARAEAYYRDGGSFNGNFGLAQRFIGDNFYEIEDRSHGWLGFSGRGFAAHGATFGPPSPGVNNGAFTSLIMEACTSAEIWTGATTGSEDRAYGLASGRIKFHVTTQQQWSWIGGWQGATYDSGIYYQVSGSITLFDITGGGSVPIVDEQRVSLNGVGDWAEPINFAGTLNPGSYELAWSHESIAANGFTPWGFYGVGIGGAPLVSCIDSTFRLIPTPGTALIVIFGLAGGTRRRR